MTETSGTFFILIEFPLLYNHICNKQLIWKPEIKIDWLNKLEIIRHPDHNCLICVSFQYCILMYLCATFNQNLHLLLQTSHLTFCVDHMTINSSMWLNHSENIIRKMKKNRLTTFKYLKKGNLPNSIVLNLSVIRLPPSMTNALYKKNDVSNFLNYWWYKHAWPITVPFNFLSKTNKGLR